MKTTRGLLPRIKKHYVEPNILSPFHIHAFQLVSR